MIILIFNNIPSKKLKIVYPYKTTFLFTKVKYYLFAPSHFSNININWPFKKNGLTV